MKFIPSLVHLLRHQKRSRGVALVMVLSSLVLIAMLVLLLLSMARTEQQSSSAFAESTNVRNLAEIPLNLAIGQIRKATEQLGGQKTWASQPGMIRTFGTEDDGSGILTKATALYKLYSDDTMVVAGVGDTGLTPVQVQSAVTSDITEMANWEAQKGLYVDLNEPAPVMDIAGTTPEWEFPIVDPRGMVSDGSSMAIDGFSLKSSLNGAVLPASRTDGTARLPMPVKWLYVLQDGRLATSTGQNAEGEVTFDASTGHAPTDANPIVGRIAFWTDDESTKVNINTALEGVPWETPRTTSQRDFDYGERMPAQNEFVRYPGHPAQTCLSPVFQAFGSNFVMTPNADEATRIQRLEHLHAISPRYVWGGTRGGSQKATEAILTNKKDRLYSTLDELLYNTDRESNDSQIDGRDLAIGKFFLTTNSRANELTPMNKPKVLLWPLSKSSTERTAMDRLMAMLSASGVEGGNSRSVGFFFERTENAEITTGRVGSGHTTYQDIHKNNRSTTMLGDYLRYYMGNPSNGDVNFIPGFVGWKNTSDKLSFGSRSKYGTGKRNQILIQMWDLLRFGVNTENTVEDDLPGGVTYKFLPPHKDPVENPSRRAESSAAPLNGFNETYKNQRADTGAVVSTYGSAFTYDKYELGSINSVKGFGRFPTITEATLVFHKRNANTMRAFLIVEPFSPTCGPPAWTANWRYRVLFGGQSNTMTPKNNQPASFQLRFSNEEDWLPMKFPRPHNPAGPQSFPGGTPSLEGLGLKHPTAENHAADYSLIRDTWPVSMVNYPVDLMADSQTLETGNTTPFAGLLTQFKRAMWTQGAPPDLPVGKHLNPPDVWKSSLWTKGTHQQQADHFVFYTRDEITIPEGATQFQFSGGKITIAIFLGWTGDDKHLPVQRIHMDFPASTFPVPTSAPGAFATRFNSGTAEGMRTNTILAGDVTRSVEPDPLAPPQGDLRHYAAMETVPENYFKPGPNYHNSSIKFDHALRDGVWMTELQLGGITTASTAGTLLEGVTYPNHAIPAVTRGVNGAKRIDGRPGDWDTGIGGIEDGPYINKPDEGTGALPKGGYFTRGGQFASEDGTTFSPNRMLASGVIFGSLPTGIIQNYPDPEGNSRSDWPSRFRNWPARQTAPWQTLLFCPNPAGRTTPAGQEPTLDDHPGFVPPRDHLLLDLFTMPIVEPYAISDNFSTAGKINLNHQLMPFTHIERSTGLHAVFKGTHVTAIPTAEVDRYKNPNGNPLEFRYTINAAATLEGINTRFDNWDVYRSPSEICNIFLVPARIPGGNYGNASPPPTVYTDMLEWWNGSINNMSDAMELTGDNVREAPYNAIYPRLTTQSNTYTVHYRVQTLRKARSTNASVWVEGKDAINSEYRGSAIVERYLDPNEQELGSVGVGTGKFINAWDSFFRFRIIQNKQFAR